METRPSVCLGVEYFSNFLLLVRHINQPLQRIPSEALVRAKYVHNAHVAALRVLVHHLHDLTNYVPVGAPRQGVVQGFPSSLKQFVKELLFGLGIEAAWGWGATLVCGERRD